MVSAPEKVRFDAEKLENSLARYQKELSSYLMCFNADELCLYSNLSSMWPNMRQFVLNLEKNGIINVVKGDEFEKHLSPSREEFNERLNNRIKEGVPKLKSLGEEVNYLIRQHGLCILGHEYHQKGNHDGNLYFRIDTSFNDFFKDFTIDFLFKDVDSGFIREKDFEYKKDGYFGIAGKDNIRLHYMFLKNYGDHASTIQIDFSQEERELGKLEIFPEIVPGRSWRNETPPTMIEGNYIKGISQIIAEYVERKQGKLSS